MRKTGLVSVVLTALLLTACGGGNAGQEPPQQAAETGNGDKLELTFTVEGQTESVPAALYTGEGYSICIPEEGWRLEQATEDGDSEERWESTVNDDVELRVLRFPGWDLRTAMNWLAAEEDDYVFEDLMGGTWGDSLMGLDDDGDALCFMGTESGDVAFLVVWEYPAEGAEGFGTRLAQIAGTFTLEA